MLLLGCETAKETPPIPSPYRTLIVTKFNGKITNVVVKFYADKSLDKLQDVEVYLESTKGLVADLESVREQMKMEQDSCDN